MDKEATKAKIAELKALRKASVQENHDRVIAYRECAKINKAFSAEIHTLEDSIREAKISNKLENLSIAQVEVILADLKAKNAE